MFVPSSVVCWREGYTKEAFFRDLAAGLVVGVVALPLALAFAIASGVPPERGLYTAIVAGFLISALGGSRVQIGGPTGAFVVIVYGIVTKHGYDGLVVATILAGFMLVGLGLARLGALIKFIPYPVTTGFTSGIAVIIFSSQVKDLFGLRMGAVPAEFLEKWFAFAEHATSASLPTLLVAFGSLVIVIVWPKITTKLPGPFVAMALATAVVQLFDLPVETIGSRFGGIPAGLPRPSFPDLWHFDPRPLVAPAMTIALLAGIESLLSAVVADGMIGSRHKSNMELVAQGIANIVSPIFGGIPATGAIARTATNIKTGGRTPLAGIIHALTLLIVLLAAGKWAAMIPLAALAAILVVVSYNMSEWRSFRALLSAPRGDVVVLLLTFLLTIFVDLTVAVQVGVIAAALLFMKRMSEVTAVEGVTDTLEDSAEDLGEISQIDGGRRLLSSHTIPDGVEVFEINGPFFFGAADKLKDVLSEISTRPKVLVLRMRSVPAIDATGIHALVQVATKSRKERTAVILSECRPEVRSVLVRSDLFPLVRREGFASSLPAALERAAGMVRDRASAIHRRIEPGAKL